MSEAKPFCISKWEVWEAYKRVKANQGAAGVDEQTIADFERNLKRNLYKIWNRMSSGSYFPPPVRTVKIPKANGGERKLGIPTVSDRIAQQVVKSRLEPAVDPLFHPDSYGYRPGKSALDAVGQARQRCWRYDWIVDLDIKGFFDNIPQDLLIRAVKKHAKEQWMVLYIERWLKAPVQEEDGQWSRVKRARRKAGSLALCWPICFCIMPLIGGWRSGMHSCRLNVSPMMPSCTAGQKWKPRRFGQR
jgi:RNA-directed DNA polymerase